MQRAEYLPWAASALLIAGFADWFARWRKERAAPQGLNATDLVNASGIGAEAAIQQTMLGEGSGAVSGTWGNIGPGPFQSNDNTGDIAVIKADAMNLYYGSPAVALLGATNGGQLK